MSKKINNKIDELTKKFDAAVTSFKEYLIEKEKEIYAKITGYFTKDGHEGSGDVTDAKNTTITPQSTVKSKPATKARKLPVKKVASTKKPAAKPRAVANTAVKEPVELNVPPAKSVESSVNTGEVQVPAPIIKESPAKKKAPATKKTSTAKINKVKPNVSEPK